MFNVTSQMLQKKEGDLFQVVQFMNRVKNEILQYRNDSSIHQIFQNARELWDSCDLDPELAKFQITRTKRRKKMPGEGASDEPMEDPQKKITVEVVYATVDSMVSELQQHTDGLREITDLFGFLSSSS